MSDSLGFSVAPSEIERVSHMFAQENSELRATLAKTSNELVKTREKLNRATNQLSQLGYDVSEYEVDADGRILDNSNGIYDVAEIVSSDSESIYDLADIIAVLDERVTALEEKGE